MTVRTTMDPARMRAEADRITAALRLLAHPDRMLLLCTLSQREMCVSELEEELDLHQPSLSQQLGVLRSEGVVAPRKDGKNVFYKVTDPTLMQILAALYRTFCPKE
ncbi:helix-turn-helix transcriptional regulator [Ramlibacter ginsenosidimutans]|uniref:Helix-turn-helix transcriptional regulator n=1 Tax=Ramlibacter ginsenosidimutans TaxID=502333 RepID=A0A934TSM5_9BURK|nr:metalloregulator ArsR/SmtB family transcription factor [Ramlibacter ginsenosidimutans]MBK6006821.1 helix-turn-helix transcriptional regulator [Ramlibacter ginsenosidimutans]